MATTIHADMHPEPATSSLSIERAIISVSDKTGLAEFARELSALGVELFSTGGTRQFLADRGLEVADVAGYTGFPEMMDGRVKTLHPKIFGGILCRRDHPGDMQSAAEHEILRFDLVIVNLYPFAETIARPDVTIESAIENIDIGGPSLVRAAAKNSRFVAIATAPEQYPEILRELRETGGTSSRLRQRLMAEAFAHTAQYDQMIAGYFARQGPGDSAPAEDGLPPSIHLKLNRRYELRYGENPHQSAALYDIAGAAGPRLSDARQLHGKELSFNNWLDLNSALTMASSFEDPACVVIKHNNPCGAATGGSLADVLPRAMAGDPVSAFGSILAMNRELDSVAAEFLANGEFFVECILATGFSGEAMEILTTRPKWKKNVRLLCCPMLPADAARLDIRGVPGGMLVQRSDELQVDSTPWKIEPAGSVDDRTRLDLEFAWNMVRFVKSNAILLANHRALCGVGAGQMSRVDAVKIAIEKAGERARGSVLASDAFFPFPDSIEIAAAAGIRAIIQPGGSVKDSEVVAACAEHSIPLVLTGRRHFLH